MSGVPVDAVYGEGPVAGEFPYTRGIYPEMYRSRLWTMRMFAGFGTAVDTNGRFKEILGHGGTGLSTAFDMPTLMGRDSDDEVWSAGEVGRAGVAVDTLADMEDLFADIDLGSVSTSMTINGPAVVALAQYIAVADKTGVDRAALSGTIQNDILKEYQAQKEYIFPPRPSMRIVTDMMRFTTAEMPRWHPVSISGYHIREAGSTAAQELGFTLANGFAYVEAAQAAGLDVDDFAGRFSFFFNSHSDFFEEIGKYRAARRIWATWMRDRYGATSERSLMCRFHTQTAGVSLTAQQPEINIARVALQALAGAWAAPSRCTPDAYDEALALPTEKAARIALRTQQIVAHETGVANVADPLGGSAYVEWMTDEMERRKPPRSSTTCWSWAAAPSSRASTKASTTAISWARSPIPPTGSSARSTTAPASSSASTPSPKATTARSQPVAHRSRTPRTFTAQAAGRRQAEPRRATQCTRSLEAVKSAAADPAVNLMVPVIDAVKAYATEGEICDALAEVFGRYVEQAIV